MRITIQTLGSRGDVQPYCALALALQGRGHLVQLVAPDQFSAMAAELGIPFVSLPAEFLALIDSRAGKQALGGKAISGSINLLRQVGPLVRQVLEVEGQAIADFGPDLIIHHPKSMASPHMAEKLGVPCVLACPLPGFTPTAAWPSPLIPVANLGPLNWASHLLATKSANVLFGKLQRQWRQDVLGLPAKTAHKGPDATLYAYSPSVVPKPADWGDDVLVSGYWFLDTPDWVMPDALQRFLAAGDAPVYVGFGSMPGIDPERFTKAIIDGLARAGKRGLLATGGGALSASTAPDHIHILDAAPHDQLFAHVSATMHHGGAGTTAAALRAGKPTTICPFFGDQPFWARRLHNLGVSPPPLDRKRLTAEHVASALQAMDAPAMRHNAAALGARIRAETGIANAIARLETLASAK